MAVLEVEAGWLAPREALEEWWLAPEEALEEGWLAPEEVLEAGWLAPMEALEEGCLTSKERGEGNRLTTLVGDHHHLPVMKTCLIKYTNPVEQKSFKMVSLHCSTCCI